MRVVWSLLLLALSAAACSDSANERPQTVLVDAGTPPRPVRDVLQLPKRPGSFRFAAIGDAGRGDRWQYEVSRQMQAFREEFPFDFVVMLGDNVYDGGTVEDYRQKFELPYEPFLKAGIPFYAAIGNHDDPNQPSYPLFNMGGQRYYTFKPKAPLLAQISGTDVQFFMIDTERLDQSEREWLDREMMRSDARWKIPVFHRPIYTSGRYATSARALRGSLEPLFVEHGVRVALSGHEHFYERIRPQRGITYFVSGAAGSLRAHDLRLSGITAKGFDTDYSFMLFEIAGEELFFQSISRTGQSVDAGVIRLNQDKARR